MHAERSVVNEAAETIALYVRERRRANGMTQTDLALLAGVGRRFVSELENGKPSLQIDKVNSVLRVFGMQLGVVPQLRSQPVARESGLTAGVLSTTSEENSS